MADFQRGLTRFIEPTEAGYPVMLEIFSRLPEGVELTTTTHVTPIPVSDDISSLSAIVLDDVYYSFIHKHSTLIQGIPVVTEVGLIPMKAKAWIDMTERRAAGAGIDGKDIRKHRTDVFRLLQLVDPDVNVTLPPQIKKDLDMFLQSKMSPCETGLPVVDHTGSAASIHATIRAETAAAGKSLSFADGMIAATALAHNLLLVTRNTQDFESISGLYVENWFN